MNRCLKPFVPFMFVLALSGPFPSLAQDTINPRALEDLKGFQQKAEEGDTLFNQKKYAEAAAAFSAANALYQRAERRDDNAGRVRITLKTGAFPALRYYGYGMGSNASLSENVNGGIDGSYAGFHNAVTEMWQDAAILGGLDKVPRAGALNDPPLVDLSDEELGSMISSIYGPVSLFKLPVKDDEWREVVLMSRRAQLIVDYALQKHPDWKTTKHAWSQSNSNLEPTGDEVVADIKAKLAEAEPEYAKVAADYKKAEPRALADIVAVDMETLDRNLANVKKSGWLDWTLARDIYITKDYVSGRQAVYSKIYANDGKTLPAGRMKPLETKISEIMAAAEQNASRWKFPAGKPHDAAIESRASAAVKAKFPGATVLKTALDDSDWAIAKNDLGLPRYRTKGVLLLVQIPGQRSPWLLLASYDQSYSGGGTYNSGTITSYSQARLQGAN